MDECPTCGAPLAFRVETDDRVRPLAVIEQAKGIVMAKLNIDADEALRMLMASSQNENQKLQDLAQRIVAKRTIGLPLL